MSAAMINTKWNADLYNNKHGFVFKYGEELLHLLQPKEGERILDLGCGTGHLTDLIAKSGANVIGMDNSKEMIAKAQAEFPRLSFSLQSATNFSFEQPFDAIFSNAVLHWIPEKEGVIDSIYHNLKTGGRMVVEFGGKDNVNNIVRSLRQALSNNGFSEAASLSFWYFPSLGEYASLLEQRGFRVVYATHFDRDTELVDTDNGIKDWIKMFGANFLKNIDEETTEKILSEVQEDIRATNFKNGKWYADYKRLRVVALKP